MKLTGNLSHEVMDLLTGDKDKKSATLPPLVPTIQISSRTIQTQKPARPWVWAPFSSSARSDGALFRHWVRSNVEYPDYPYARFDVHLDAVTYTDEEYARLLQDNTWTKSDTDRLVELARTLELRWAVICDHWRDQVETSGNLTRGVEDLQHRYYSVAAILTQARVTQEAATEAAALAASADSSTENVMETAAARALATAEPQHQPIMATLGTGSTNQEVFDLAKEKERRKQLEFIWHRSKEEEEEELQLRKELRMIDAQLRKLKKSGGHILAAAGKNPTSKVGGSAASSANPSRAVSPVDPTLLLDQSFASTAPTPTPGTPYLQSGRLVPPATGGPAGINKTTLKRMETILQELNVSTAPLPTKRVCDLFDSVRKDALTLLTLQKMVLHREGQLQTKRLRLAKLGGGGRVLDEETLLGIAPPAPPPAPATAASGRPTKTTTTKTTKGKGTGKGKGKAKAAAAGDGGKADDKPKSAKKVTKRKKKTDAAAATPAAGTAEGKKADGDEPKSAKKRARKT